MKALSKPVSKPVSKLLSKCSSLPFDDRLIPEGCPRIAQRFNVGISAQEAVSPEGTAENAPSVSRPFGTDGSLLIDPNVETLGYSRPSLRDENLIERHLDRN